MDALGLGFIVIGVIIVIFFQYRPKGSKKVGSGLFILGLGLGILINAFFVSPELIIPISENFYINNFGVIIAVIGAIAALILSLVQGYESKKFNRLSVKPRLMITEILTGSNCKIGVFVFNGGLGSADIVAVRYYVSGIEIVGKSNTESIFKVKELLNLENISPECKIGVLQTTDVIGSGCQLDLIYWEAGTFNFNRIQEFYIEIQKLRIEIDYKSFYEEDFNLNHQIEQKR